MRLGLLAVACALLPATDSLSFAIRRSSVAWAV